MRSRFLPFFLLTGALLASCGSYRQNILFQVSPEEAEAQRLETESNYTIRPNDLLSLDVYTNRGEKIVDPNRESFKDGNVSTSEQLPFQYLVDTNGLVKFPLIEEIKVSDLTIKQAEQILQQEYGKFYEDAFVILRFHNKRVIVLGAPGGQVIPLTNENMRLAEVIALAKGVPTEARVNNIRVIRNDAVFIADLSTFAGYQKNNLVMQSGDIVYVEPVRRPFKEALRDYSPVISVVTSLATLIFIISQVN